MKSNCSPDRLCKRSMKWLMWQWCTDRRSETWRLEGGRERVRGSGGGGRERGRKGGREGGREGRERNSKKVHV